MTHYGQTVVRIAALTAIVIVAAACGSQRSSEAHAQRYIKATYRTQPSSCRKVGPKMSGLDIFLCRVARPSSKLSDDLESAGPGRWLARKPVAICIVFDHRAADWSLLGFGYPNAPSLTTVAPCGTPSGY